MKIRFENLSIFFSNELGKQKELCDNLTFEAGSKLDTGMSGIILPANSGKSVLAASFAGLNNPDSGNIYFNDIEIQKLNALLVNCQKAFPGLSLRDLYSNLTSGDKSSKTKVGLSEVASLVGLEGYEEHVPSVLSLGFQMRLMVAAGLINNCDLFIADDPFFRLSQSTATEIADLFIRISAIKPVLLISSDLRVTVQIAKEYFLFDAMPLKFLSGGEVPAESGEKKILVREIADRIMALENKLFVKYYL
ncbi:MAG: ATP-binding cassette domain-containing protein [Ignavibacteriaceae bacterium]|nr:ATP-binding cassette domain-containing protein [Ignavibacteriaceae bacterium]